MSKRIRGNNNLFEDEQNNDISLEDLIKQDEEEKKKLAKLERKEKLKGTAKKVGTTAVDLTKRGSKWAKNELEEAKAERDKKIERGEETLDQKAVKQLSGLGISATWYKAKLIKRLKPLLANEVEEKTSNNNAQSAEDERNWFYFKIVAVIVGIFLVLNYWRLILPLFLIYKYLSTQIKYARYATLFDFKWYHDLLKQSGQKEPAQVAYLLEPLNLVGMDNQLENYLEQRGKKGMYSGQKEYASIQNSRVELDDRYGYVRVFNIDNRFFKKSAESLEDVELSDYFMIPQRTSYNELTSKIYYAVHDEVRQCIAPLLRQISREQFLRAIIEDNDINGGFPEIADQLAELKAQEAARLAKEAEENELAELNEQISAKGLSQETANILMKIRKNVDIWNFNIWNGNDNLSGNASYFKVRCILRNSKSLNDIKRIQSTIESELRHSIVLNERQDKRAFDLTVILKAQLDPFSLKVADLKKYNQDNKLYIGKSYTGDLFTEWNYQANHFVIAGKSGSGKSEAIRELLAQFSWLDESKKDFDYTTMFLTSSSKIGDFADFGKRGALVSAGIDNQIAVFSYILNELEQRESKFYEVGVQNIKDYNKKFPDKRLKQLILLADEYENTRGDLDKKKAAEAESLMVSILNIARSSGCVVLIGAQSILKQDIGTVKDKMTIRFSGKNEKNVLNTVDPSIASYYSSYRGKPQGVFFYQADNLEFKGDYITQGDTSFTLIQTPYISDISTKTLPELSGAELSDEIFKNNFPEEDSKKKGKNKIDTSFID